jgi:hypothetical protein
LPIPATRGGEDAVRSTIFIIVALLCAGLCHPVRAQDGAAAPSVPVFDLHDTQFLPAVIGSEAETPAAVLDVPFAAIDRTGNVSDTVALTVPAAPVPEPVSVLMLMCGLLLIVPGGWLGRWAMLGDRESLLRRRPS